LKQAMSVELDGLDKNKVLQLLDAQANEELYKYLLITQCNELNRSLPEMFETISNWTELLFPANLLRSDSVLDRMVTEIPEEDWQDAVQIIGWLYQYYNTELKDDTFAKLKKNIKITKERVPAATQLFTPDWIVRYMVENSLGRLWLEGHPDAELHDGWKYYLDEAEQEPEVEAQLAKLREEYKAIKPEEIKVIDPCMGSGHILVYAFDVLMQIYTSAGWDQREAAQSILKNNLYGLDIDDRAAQLAYFAVMMKARKYDRRLLTRGIQPNIFSIRESNGIQTRTVEYFHKNDPKLKADIESIVAKMRDAKEYGSILNITPVDFAGLYARFDEIRNDISLLRKAALAELLPLVKCAEVLAQKYDVVVTNPPYMGASGMNVRLAEYVKSNYPNTKSDMSTVFMERTVKMCKKAGYMSMINIPVWMFLSSYEKLRESLIAQDTFANMVHFGRGVFGSDFGTTAFVIAKVHINEYKGTYCRLFEKQGAVDSVETKEKRFLEGMGRFVADQSNFSKIPGSPVAYWVSERVLQSFMFMPSFGNYFEPRQGLATGDDETFLRYWHEVDINKLSTNCTSKESLWHSGCKYVPFNKGGAYRKWYGNNDYVIAFDVVNYNRLSQQGNKLPSKQYYFHEGVTWSALTSALFSGRYCGIGYVFAGKGPMCFSNDPSNTLSMCALMNSKPFAYFYRILSATMDFNQGTMRCIPYATGSEQNELYTNQCIQSSKSDWDSYETSWDFKRNPLV